MELMESEDVKTYKDMIQNNIDNFKKLHTIQAIKFSYDAKELAKLFLTEDVDAITANLGDGRSVSWYAEPSIVTAYGLNINPNKNGLYDSSISTNCKCFPDITVGIKSLSNNGLDLMQSGFKGRGFKGITKDQKYNALVSSIMLCDYHIICDIIDSPKMIYCTPLSSLQITYLIYTGVFTSLSLQRNAYYNMFFGNNLNTLDAQNFFYHYKGIPL